MEGPPGGFDDFDEALNDAVIGEDAAAAAAPPQVEPVGLVELRRIRGRFQAPGENDFLLSIERWQKQLRAVKFSIGADALAQLQASSVAGASGRLASDQMLNALYGVAEACLYRDIPAVKSQIRRSAVRCARDFINEESASIARGPNEEPVELQAKKLQKQRQTSLKFFLRQYDRFSRGDLEDSDLTPDISVQAGYGNVMSHVFMKSPEQDKGIIAFRRQQFGGGDLPIFAMNDAMYDELKVMNAFFVANGCRSVEQCRDPQPEGNDKYAWMFEVIREYVAAGDDPLDEPEEVVRGVLQLRGLIPPRAQELKEKHLPPLWGLIDDGMLIGDAFWNHWFIQVKVLLPAQRDALDTVARLNGGGTVTLPENPAASRQDAITFHQQGVDHNKTTEATIEIRGDRRINGYDSERIVQKIKLEHKTCKPPDESRRFQLVSLKQVIGTRNTRIRPPEARPAAPDPSLQKVGEAMCSYAMGVMMPHEAEWITATYYAGRRENRALIPRTATEGDPPIHPLLNSARRREKARTPRKRIQTRRVLDKICKATVRDWLAECSQGNLGNLDNLVRIYEEAVWWDTWVRAMDGTYQGEDGLNALIRRYVEDGVPDNPQQWNQKVAEIEARKLRPADIQDNVQPLQSKIESKRYSPMLEAMFIPMRFVCFLFLVATQYQKPLLGENRRVRIQDPQSEFDKECGEITAAGQNGQWIVALDGREEPVAFPGQALDTWDVLLKDGVEENQPVLKVRYCRIDPEGAQSEDTWSLFGEEGQLEEKNGRYGIVGQPHGRCPTQYSVQTPGIRDASVQCLRRRLYLTGEIEVAEDGAARYNHLGLPTVPEALPARELEASAYELRKLNVLHPDYFKDEPNGPNVFMEALRRVKTVPKSKQAQKKSAKKKETLFEACEKQRRYLAEQRPNGPNQPFLIPRHTQWSPLPDHKKESHRCGIAVVAGSTYDPASGHFYPQQGGVIREVAGKHTALVYSHGQQLLEDLRPRGADVPRPNIVVADAVAAAAAAAAAAAPAAAGQGVGGQHIVDNVLDEGMYDAELQQLVDNLPPDELDAALGADDDPIWDAPINEDEEEDEVLAEGGV